MSTPIQGFSKLSKEEKINWVSQTFTQGDPETKSLLTQYWHEDKALQKLHDEFIENTLSNFYVPFGIAPNFLINDKLYAIPMAIEESSVVAAASKAAKFWGDRGGFKTAVLGTEKIGQVHFFFKGDSKKLKTFFTYLEPILLADCASLTTNMEKRGGGISAVVLRDKTSDLANYFQIHAVFQTADAMGANFIIDGASGAVFAQKMVQAVAIAKVEPHRAVTHNKGIMNGVDAVVLATGNDFRAIEAGVHAYAAKDGSYSSLTHATIENGVFSFWIELPLALGTVGGLTNLHPLVKWSLAVLQKPSAKELMEIVAVAGLAQNFAALHSLVTSGIQKGHMKMHLLNILNQLGATEAEKIQLAAYYKDQTATHSHVVSSFETLRKKRSL